MTVKLANTFQTKCHNSNRKTKEKLCSFVKTSVLGQSDIKKLLRENYRLRTENWTLRDEYDRLDKLLKTKNQSNATDSHEFQDCNKHGYEYDDSDRYCGCCGDEVSTIENNSIY